MITRYKIDEFNEYRKIVKDIPDFFNNLGTKKKKSYNVILDKLNKLSDSNFDVISQEIQELSIKDEKAMIELVSTIFNKAIIEKIYISMYVKLCTLLMKYHILDGDNKISFGDKLLIMSQTAFNEFLEKKTYNINIVTFIGELFNNDILNIRIISFCFDKLSTNKLYIGIGELFRVIKSKLIKTNACSYDEFVVMIQGIINSREIKTRDKFILQGILEE